MPFVMPILNGHFSFGIFMNQPRNEGLIGETFLNRLCLDSPEVSFRHPDVDPFLFCQTIAAIFFILLLLFLGEVGNPFFGFK